MPDQADARSALALGLLRCDHPTKHKRHAFERQAFWGRCMVYEYEPGAGG